MKSGEKPKGAARKGSRPEMPVSGGRSSKAAKPKVPCSICPYMPSCIIGRRLASPDTQAPEDVFVPTPQHYKRKHVVFQSGTRPYGLYVVCSGRVKVYKVADSGRLLTNRIASGGELLGYRAFFADEPYSSNAEALEETTVRFFDREVARKLIFSRPAAVEEIMRKLALELKYSETREADFLYKPARQRLYDLLAYLGKVYASQAVVSLTREDLAEMAGLTPETTVRLLKEFHDAGAVRSLSYGRLKIDTEKLAKLPQKNDLDQS